ncbi:hypothetical protein [Phascolarctobacterium succinatutens]|jgi:hypothetical protein|uniref:hypothetical protein n=1 Tax=Phascolarctobacterium succinatutens TaxID=626940 RepID=UPI00204783D7|nr:MAG TPA: hypothetical protein [Caudoviricetes sp.]
MFESTIQTIINIIAGAVISYIFALYRAKKRENDALRAGVQALLRDRIIQAYNHYVCEKGWVPIYAKESIDACYKSYEALGDNGVIDSLMEQLNELPNYNLNGGKNA